MLRITTRKYTTNSEQAFQTTEQYMELGMNNIKKLILDSIKTLESIKLLFEMLFSEVISDLYINKFWTKYNGLMDEKKEALIDIIAEWYCEMGNIMGYYGTVLLALNEV